MSPASTEQTPSPASEIQVPMPTVVKFIRQLSHDFRNHLNAAELQSAYLAEIAEEPELKEEIKRLRSMISEAGTSLQKVTSLLSQPRLNEMRYAANDFFEDLKQKLAADYADESSHVEWSIGGGEAMLQIDPQLLQLALLEIFANAFRHDRVKETILAQVRTEGNSLLFTVREPKSNFEKQTENWGREPLHTVAQGHYGLGLHRTRVIIEAHRGQLHARYDKEAASLVTTVTLPLAGPEK